MVKLLKDFAELILIQLQSPVLEDMLHVISVDEAFVAPAQIFECFLEWRPLDGKLVEYLPCYLVNIWKECFFHAFDVFFHFKFSFPRICLELGVD